MTCLPARQGSFAYAQDDAWRHFGYWMLFGYLFLGYLVIGISFAYAQTAPISLDAEPEYPSPGDEFTVEASTPTFNKNSAIFTWRVNNRLREDLSGLGENSITLTAGPMGEITNIKVRIVTADGLRADAEKNILVSDLSLVWSADTYIPKWYKGRALPVPGAAVNITALPDFVFGGRRYLPSTLIYRWSVDGGPPTRESFGRQTFSFKMSDRSDSSHTVSVTVDDPTRQIKKQASVTINSYVPRLLFYQASPLGGVESRFSPASVSASLNKLVDIVSEPFFFATRSKNNLFYRWFVAGSEIQGQPQDPSSITIDTGKTPYESVPVSLYVENLQDGGRPVNKSFDLRVK